MAANYSDHVAAAFPDADEAMASESRILARIAATTDAFIQVADLDYRWLAINKASADEFERIFGVRPQIGQNMLDVLAHLPEHQAAVRAVWSRALAGEEFTEIGEFGESERRSYAMKYNSYFDDGGNRVGAFQIVTDVTERVQAERKLAEAEAALRQSQKMEAIGQLTGGLAHDFNNLLQIIAGNLGMLQQRLQSSDPKTKRYIENALRGASRATELTHRLLAFARPTPGVPRVIDANSVISGMSDLIRQAVGERVHLSVNLASEPAAINADPNQLEGAILNLVVNARDAMPGGGRLSISTQIADREAKNAIRDPSVVTVVIEIADTGEGMDKATLDRVFDPFFTTKEAGRGTGLGLAMVYGFVRMADGDIRVDSTLGKGTTFRLAFPRVSGEEASDLFPDSQTIPRGNDQIILVVQDDDDVRQHSVEVLRDLGYRVLEAHDGRSALSLLEKHGGDIALMFCDIGLPDGRGGRELAADARRDHPALKILYTSGAADEDSAFGPDGTAELLLAKPFTTANLAGKIREALEMPLPPSNDD